MLTLRSPAPAARAAVLWLAASALSARSAFASGGSSMPWDAPLQALLSNLAGPSARALVLIAIVGTGLLARRIGFLPNGVRDGLLGASYFAYPVWALKVGRGLVGAA